jgi:hypothetical protein
MHSAIETGRPSPVPTAAMTSARANPIETAVTATAVDNASAAVMINSTSAMGRCLGAQPWRLSRSHALRRTNVLGISISSNQSSNLLRPMPAPVRPELGEGFG